MSTGIINSVNINNIVDLIDWLVFNANFSSISAILWHHAITSVLYAIYVIWSQSILGKLKDWIIFFYHMFWIHFFPLCHFFMDWQKIRNLVTLEILVLAYCSLLQTFILQKTSITLWKIEGQIDNNSTWVPVYEISDPDARTILVPNLRPFTNCLSEMKYNSHFEMNVNKLIYAFHAWKHHENSFTMFSLEFYHMFWIHFFPHKMYGPPLCHLGQWL
jgi:hypothetical protein